MVLRMVLLTTKIGIMLQRSILYTLASFGRHYFPTLDDDHGEGDGYKRDDQVLHIWKRRKRNKNEGDQGKGIR